MYSFISRKWRMDTQKKIIGINALFLVPNSVGGTEYHLRSFVKYLQKLDKTNEYVLFCNRENYNSFKLTSPHWKKILCPVSATNRIARILYEQLLFPFTVHKAKCAVLHSFGYFGPIVMFSTPHVVTVHDANWRDHPEDNSWFYNLVFGFLTEQSMRYARIICTDSEFGKARLLVHFPHYAGKIKVISPGVDDDFLKLLKKKTTNPLGAREYLLCVSAFYPHKQVAEFLEWWRTAQNEKKLQDLWLVIIGKNGRDTERVQNLASSIERTKLLAKVSYAELVQYYQHATAVVHPSKYEGFGYPVYEGVAAGKRVFVSDERMYDEEISYNLIKLNLKVKKSDIHDFFNKTFSSNYNLKKKRVKNYLLGSKKLIDVYNNL